nr:hypothetical protein [Tanacetum cinerariifolium]
MSEASSAVTYTSVYADSEPRRVFWGAEEELSDGGSLRVIVYGYDGLPMMPVAPPSPDYIPSPEEPQTAPTPQDEDEHELMFIQPHDPNFVSDPIYPEYIPLEDEHILPAEEQPLPPVVSPTAESPGYVAELDPEGDPEEYEEDEAEDSPVDYPIEGGDDGNDYDGDSSGYDADDEEEEEHLAPADSAVVIPIDELVSTPEGIEPTIPPPSTNTTTIRARITIRPQTSISLPPETEVERLLAMPTPSPSPLTSLSPPSAGEHLARCMAPAALPSPPLPPSSYPPSPIDRRDGIPESEQPPRKRLCLATLGSRYEDLYALLEDAHDGRTRISQRVAMDSQRVDLLMGDRMTLQETVWIMEKEAYAAREAWAQLIVETLRVMREMRREMGDMQAELLALRGQPRRAGQPGGDVKVLNHQGAPRDADNPDFRSRGLCNDLGSAQEEDDGKFVANENEKIDKYISGLPDNIYGNVKSSKPRTLDETIELTNDLMDQKLHTYAERADNKRKTEDTSRNNHGHKKQPYKKQNVAKKCHKCNKVGHFARDCRSSSNANVTNAQRDGKETPKGNGCFECGASGHFKRDYPKLKSKNGGNRNAQGWVYAVGNAKKNENVRISILPLIPVLCILRPLWHYKDLPRDLLPIRPVGQSQNPDVGGVNSDEMRRGKRKTFPSKYQLSPFTCMPTTTVAPKKRANNIRNTMRNAKVSPFNLGKASIDLNSPVGELMYMGSCATDDYISLHNVDPNKVVQNKYVNCMRFLESPESVFLDCFIKGFVVEHINCWMELMIRARSPSARYTVAKTGTSAMLDKSSKFVIEIDFYLMGMLYGSSRPYPSWDDVDIVSLYAHQLRM